MMSTEWSSEHPWQSPADFPGNFLAWNLGVLEDRDPEWAGGLRSLQPELSCVKIKVFSASHVTVQLPDSQPLECVTTPADLQTLQNQVQPIAQAKPPVVIWHGCGVGQWLLPLFQILHNDPGIALWIYEQFPLKLLVGMSLWDWGPVLASGRVFWATGDDFNAAMESSARRYGLFMKMQQPPPLFAFPQESSQRRYEFQRDVLQLTHKMQQWRREVLQKGDLFLRQRSQRSPTPQKIWSAVSVNHYAARPILRALHRGLTECGLECVLTETLPGLTALQQKRIGLIEARPDTVLSVNNSTCIDVPSGELHRIVWVTDDPQFQQAKSGAEKRFTDEELILFADPLYRDILARQGAQRLGHLPAFALLDRTGDPAQAPSYPLLFVGVIHPVDHLLQSIPHHVRDCLENACDALLHSDTGTVGAMAYWQDSRLSDSFLHTARNVYAELFHKPPVTKIDYAWLVELTYTLAVNRKRAAIAKALFPLGLHVHGNSAWKEIAGDMYLDRCHPTVRYEILADLYAAAAVCINIHSPQLPTSLNIRDFDVLRASGCLLTDPVAGMNAETLLPGRDCLTAAGPEEFAATANDLLHDAERRRELAETGQATVLARHLARHRAETILELSAGSSSPGEN